MIDILCELRHETTVSLTCIEVQHDSASSGSGSGSDSTFLPCHWAEWCPAEKCSTDIQQNARYSSKCGTHGVFVHCLWVALVSQVLRRSWLFLNHSLNILSLTTRTDQAFINPASLRFIGLCLSVAELILMIFLLYIFSFCCRLRIPCSF